MHAWFGPPRWGRCATEHVARQRDGRPPEATWWLDSAGRWRIEGWQTVQLDGPTAPLERPRLAMTPDPRPHRCYAILGGAPGLEAFSLRGELAALDAAVVRAVSSPRQR